MANLTAPDRSWDIGVPKQESHDFGITPTGLIIGEYPVQFTQGIGGDALESPGVCGGPGGVARRDELLDLRKSRPVLLEIH